MLMTMTVFFFFFLKFTLNNVFILLLVVIIVLFIGVQIYRNFYSEEKERLNGVLAIRVTKPSPQLSDAMASILRVSFHKTKEILSRKLLHNP